MGDCIVLRPKIKFILNFSLESWETFGIFPHIDTILDGGEKTDIFQQICGGVEKQPPGPQLDVRLIGEADVLLYPRFFTLDLYCTLLPIDADDTPLHLVARCQVDVLVLGAQPDRRARPAGWTVSLRAALFEQLLKEHCAERNRPTRWSRSPIRLRTQYKHVYLTTRSQMERSIIRIYREKCAIQIQREEAGIEKYVSIPAEADVELWPRRLFFNAATDLLKYVRFFAAVKDDIYMRENVERFQGFKGDVQYELRFRTEDDAIAHMYPDVNEAEGAVFHVYRR